MSVECQVNVGKMSVTSRYIHAMMCMMIIV
nr:MAG TPA: hypothetical protein [Caudoviricetes sp.]